MTIGHLLTDCWSALNAKANENDSYYRTRQIIDSLSKNRRNVANLQFCSKITAKQSPCQRTINMVNGAFAPKW